MNRATVAKLEEIRERLEGRHLHEAKWKSATEAYREGNGFAKEHSGTPEGRKKVHGAGVKGRKAVMALLHKRVDALPGTVAGDAEKAITSLSNDIYQLYYYLGMMDSTF